MKKLILYHHLGLGDHFVCNGLVNFLSQKYNLIYLPCKEINFPTVNYLYSENEDVKVFKTTKDEDLSVLTFSTLISAPIIRVGFEHCNPLKWDRSFYEQLDIDFDFRYRLFNLPKKKPEITLDVPDKKYILIHNKSSFGDYTLEIDTKYEKIYVEKVNDNLLSYIDLIQNAQEIHCIDSSFCCLIDGINLPNVKLIYHDIRKTPNTSWNITKKWKIVKY
jgi:hypothetical protein